LSLIQHHGLLWLLISISQQCTSADKYRWSQWWNGRFLCQPTTFYLACTDASFTKTHFWPRNATTRRRARDGFQSSGRLRGQIWTSPSTGIANGVISISSNLACHFTPSAKRS